MGVCLFDMLIHSKFGRKVVIHHRLYFSPLSLLLPSRPSVSFLVNWIEVTWVRASHKIDVECARLITVIISAVVFSLYFLLACAASQAPLAAPAFSSFSRLFLMAAWLGMFGRFFFFFYV
jgi:hypothetical protein